MGCSHRTEKEIETIESEQCHRFELIQRRFIDKCASCDRERTRAVRKLHWNGSPVPCKLAQFLSRARVWTGQFVPYSMHCTPYRPATATALLWFSFCAESFCLPDSRRLILFWSQFIAFFSFLSSSPSSWCVQLLLLPSTSICLNAGQYYKWIEL